MILARSKLENPDLPGLAKRKEYSAKRCYALCRIDLCYFIL